MDTRPDPRETPPNETAPGDASARSAGESSSTTGSSGTTGSRDTASSGDAAGSSDAAGPPRAPRALRALGWAVRKRRKALGLTQEGLGAAAGLHRNYVGGVERGEQNPSYLNLRKLASGLGLTLARLTERAEAEQKTLPE